MMPGPFLHLKRNLLDALAAVLILRTDRQSMCAILHAARIEDDVGRQFPVDDRLRIVVEKYTNTRLVHDCTHFSDRHAECSYLG